MGTGAGLDAPSLPMVSPTGSVVAHLLAKLPTRKSRNEKWAPISSPIQAVTGLMQLQGGLMNEHGSGPREGL